MLGFGIEVLGGEEAIARGLRKTCNEGICAMRDQNDATNLGDAGGRGDASSTKSDLQRPASPPAMKPLISRGTLAMW